MAVREGTKLGPYEILSLIGAGGMGEVYRARDPRLNREVAIKVLPADRVSDEDRRTDLDAERRDSQKILVKTLISASAAKMSIRTNSRGTRCAEEWDMD
jgi:serine/threonine protein kinase